MPGPSATHEWQISGWDLVWHDEFEGPDINSDNWTHEVGGHGWGNRESQFYSDNPKNSYIEDGLLVIQALQENVHGKRFSSARLTTQDKVEFTYGRVEARIKIPQGKGLWSAFWMLGADFPEVGWPVAGEIDIMENIGSEPTRIHSTVHGPGYSRVDGVGAARSLPGEARYADDFHIFAMEWEEQEIRWYLDGEIYLKVTPDAVPGEWVYNQPFYLILNLAVGGKWPGNPDRNTLFPQTMKVDYVRVLKKTAIP